MYAVKDTATGYYYTSDNRPKYAYGPLCYAKLYRSAGKAMDAILDKQHQMHRYGERDLVIVKVVLTPDHVVWPAPKGQ